MDTREWKFTSIDVNLKVHHQQLSGTPVTHAGLHSIIPASTSRVTSSRACVHVGLVNHA